MFGLKELKAKVDLIKSDVEELRRWRGQYTDNVTYCPDCHCSILRTVAKEVKVYYRSGDVWIYNHIRHYCYRCAADFDTIVRDPVTKEEKKFNKVEAYNESPS